MSLNIRLILSRPFMQNTYVAWLDGRDDCVVIDPGLEPEQILDCLQQEELTPAAFLCTHGHADHIGGNAALKAAYPEVPLVIGEIDAPMLLDADLNLSAGFGQPLVSPPADRTIKEGETLDYAGMPLEVRHIPGHSPGHVVFIHHATPAVFGGDVLFAGGIGRWDFPGGDRRALLRGIHEKLLTLAPETALYPGHGPDTSIGEEKANNPYLEEGI